MVIIDLIGWITFALLLLGAGWAAWRVHGDLQARKQQAEPTEPADLPASEPASHEAPA